MKKNKITIAFFGITRSLPYTIESITKNIIDPALSVSDVLTIGHFFSISQIKNDRSKEYGYCNPLDYRLLNLDHVTVEPPDLCLMQWDHDKILSFGNPWCDNGASLKNLIHQLHSLHQVTTEALARQSDLVLFCRPDLMYHDNFSPVLYRVLKDVSKNRRGIYVPFWQWNGGLNDRFAICSGEAAIHAYGSRVTKVIDYLETTGKVLHAEQFLGQVIANARIKVRPMRLRASRVRLGGSLRRESFSFISHMKWRKVLARKLSKWR